MKIVIIYALIFAALIFLFFVDHSAKTAYVPLKAGLLYSTSISSQTTLNDELTEKILFKRTAEDEYPTIEAYSTASLPQKVLVRLIDAKDAKYRLMTAAEAAARPEGPGRGQNPAKQPSRATKPVIKTPEEAKAAIAAVTIQKETPLEILNINKVRDMVNNSEKSYFFPGIEKTMGDVTLTVKSVTPYQNKSILTISLNNAQSGYFFISNISVTSAGAPLQIETFNDPFIPGKKTATFFVITRQLKAEAVAVKVSESGAGKRIFDLSVAIP